MCAALNDEERLLEATVRAFARDVLAPGAIERDEAERYDRSLFSAMGELGLPGGPSSMAVGGAGLSSVAWTVVMEELGAVDMAMAVSLSAHVLSQVPMVAFGTDDQRARWLPGLQSGAEIAAFALTEPGAGSDAAALRTLAVRDGSSYRLTGTKAWISNAPEADRILVFATVDPSAGSRGITAFVVERALDGVSIGAHERKMGIRACPTAEVVLEDVPVPEADRLGGEGEGYKIALSSLGEGRISIAAACVGLARAGVEAAAAHLRERVAFGKPLAEQQGMRFMVAEMARDVAAARALTREAAAARDAGTLTSAASSLAKWVASDAAMRVTTDAVQLFGASGYSRDTGIERLMRDAKGAQIYEGTNQIHREIVAGEVLARG